MALIASMANLISRGVEVKMRLNMHAWTEIGMINMENLVRNMDGAMVGLGGQWPPPNFFF